MSSPGIEIERKFRLREAPNPDLLAGHGAVALRIEQVYLTGRTGSERVRRIEAADGVTYRSTRKHRIGPFTFEEHEEAIDEAGWLAGLARADQACRPIRKTRYVVPHGDQHLEIDVFHEPPGLVVVEVELGGEEESVTLPAWLGDWIEVTGDVRYFNAVLARLDAVVPAWGSGPG